MPGVFVRRREQESRRIANRILDVAVATLSVSTLAAFAAGTWWGLELLSNLRAHQALALAGLAVTALLCRRMFTAVAAVLAMGVNLAVVGPIVIDAAWGEPAPAAADSSALDVTFFNTKIFQADMDDTIATLAARDDDVVVLAGGTKRWVEQIEAADLDLQVLVGPHTHDGLELIALARDPGAEATVHEIGQEDRDVFVEVLVDLDGQPVRVLGTHVVSPLTADRAARRGAMLDWVPGWTGRSDVPAVVMGDLNATPWSPALIGMLEEAGLIDSQVGHGLQASYPASLRWLGIPIDHVLHGPELTTTNRRLGPSLGSDHRMVHATLTSVVGRP